MEMTSIDFGATRSVVYLPAGLGDCQSLPPALSCAGRPVITLVGYISTEPQAYRQACRTLLEQVVFPMAAHCGAALLSRGFSLDSDHAEGDLPWLIDQVAASFPEVTLVGVGLDCAAALPEKVEAEPWRSCPLNEHHSAYVLVPGLNERDACAWRTALASAITAPALPEGRAQPGVTLVFGGASMTWFDVLGAIEAGRHVIALTHDGVIGVSAGIQYLLAGGPPERTLMADLNRRLEEEAAGMVASRRLHWIAADDPLFLFDQLATLLLCSPGAHAPG
jgi:hypothetical protein